METYRGIHVLKIWALGPLCLFLHGVKFLSKSKFRQVTECLKILGMFLYYIGKTSKLMLIFSLFYNCVFY